MAFGTDVRNGGEAEDGKAAPRRFGALVLGSIGVVYGDIGTSPLYAVRESVRAASPTGAADEAAILGVISLIIWTLIVVVTVKYVIVVLRADHNGEGGTLALTALALRVARRGRWLILGLGIAGAALFYGDAMLTPAISVISAVEGLSVITPAFEPYILPITVAIIVALFAVQSRGTGRVAALFGPVTLVWFAALALAGVAQIAGNPDVLVAFNPHHAGRFLLDNGGVALLVCGAVFLAVTGAEALYADLGHFGRRPIQVAWLVVVGPALVLNYLGQGALLMDVPEAIENPLFLMVPEWAVIPMVGLATAATVIASQAVISGAFSLSRQAVQLGFLPRLEIRHTSASQVGQVYMPRINLIVAVGVLLLVLLFRSSTNLAAAYGIAVSGTMIVTALLLFLVVRDHWRWRTPWAAALIGPFVVVDLFFFGANLLKIGGGGWVPLLIAGAIAALIATWRRGTRMLGEKTRRTETPLPELVRQLEGHPPPRVPGTAVFLSGDPASAPTALLHSIKHYKVLHARNVILTVETADTPRVPQGERVRMEPIGESFLRVIVRYGFMEQPNVPKALAIARKLGLTFDIMATSFFLSRRSLRRSASSALPAGQFKLFALLARNADDATNYFQIPSGRVIEIGTQVQL